MITRLTGLLERVGEGTADVAPGDGSLVYRVMLPAFAEVRLAVSVGQRVTLHTLAYLDSANQGATLTPRLLGFLTPEDRSFFELLTTVKGIGMRKALRAMALPSEQIAAAIVDRDTKLLQTLPEIGKRGSETIVVDLKDKAARFVTGPITPGARGEAPSGTIATEALRVLVELGEQRHAAATWVDQVMSSEDPPSDVQTLLQRVYERKR